ncbi:MAG: invasion associated locus B family protein [Geminicoccaceae bacterium]
MANEVARAQEPAAPAPPPWSTRCVSEARAVAPACTAEQTVLVRQQQNNQVLLTLRLQAPASRSPLTFSVQTPLGLLLPAGLTLQVDETPPLTLPLQTCDNAGCYAATPLNDELARAYGAGGRLRIGLQTAAGETLTIEIPLEGFAEALERIR